MINIKLHKITISLRGVFEVFDAQNPTTAKTVMTLIVTFLLSFKTTEAQHLVKEFHNEFASIWIQKKNKWKTRKLNKGKSTQLNEDLDWPVTQCLNKKCVQFYSKSC